VGQAIRLAENGDPGRHVDVPQGRIPVGRVGDRRPVPQRLDDVDQTGPGPREIEVDQRVRAKAVRPRLEDDVFQVDVAVADDVHWTVNEPRDLTVPPRARVRLEARHRLVIAKLQQGQGGQR
jgi:hypothetical protein